MPGANFREYQLALCLLVSPMRKLSIGPCYEIFGNKPDPGHGIKEVHAKSNQVLICGVAWHFCQIVQYPPLRLLAFDFMHSHWDQAARMRET